MVVQINFKSGKPAHLQIIEQIKAAAASGELRPGEALPAIGPLALELRINRNVIAKAYADLESSGLIETLPDGGSVLKEKPRALRKDSRRRLLAAESGETNADAREAAQETLFGSVVMRLPAAFYFLIVAVVALALAQVAGIRSSWVAVLLTVFIAAVATPARGFFQGFVDRFVFSKRNERERALEAIKAAAASEPDLPSFMQRLIELAEGALNARLEWIHEYSAMIALVNASPSLRSTRAPISAGADLLMPVFSDSELSGVLRLVQRADGLQYGIDDSQFLAAIGGHVAIATDRFRLRREKHEGEYALEIQQGLLPREVPQAPGFAIAGAWQPARSVGGDYYDVFKLREDRFALVVADVCGKGIPAALLMANLQANVKAYATADSSPKEVCEKVNGAISSSITVGRFITLFYGVLDTSQRRLTYVNAGHNPPFVLRQDHSHLTLETGGPIIGVFPGVPYEEETIDLLSGDRLVVFTDGITEAADSTGDEFGESRLLSILRTNSTVSAAELRDRIMQTVAQFCREDFSDDVTLLTVAVDIPSP